MDSSNREFIAGFSSSTKREIASLTKIFTLYTACSVIGELDIDPKTHIVEIGYVAESKVGTTACLEPGDKISVYDLLFGLMLPSGNDAAVAISLAIGERLLACRPPDSELKMGKSGGTLPARRAFLKEMNSISSWYGLKNSCLQNSHGLTNTFNSSTAAEIATLFSHGLVQYSLFREVVNTS